MAPTKVVIVGAGWFGLVTAKTYLQIDPTIELIIFERASTVGGPWSRDRIYPGLTAQQPFGVLEYSDLRLDPPEGVTSDSFIPAEMLCNYMEAYARKFKLLDRIRFSHEVQAIDRTQDSSGWSVEYQSPGGKGSIHCDKLILATGTTSQPFVPNIEDNGFTGLKFHSQNLGVEQERLAAPEVKCVLVYGGGKSALDVVSTCVSLGKQVYWVIRKEGSGAPCLKPSHLFGRNTDTFLGSRYASKWHPNVFAREGWWYWFLHSGKSRFGYWLQWAYWGLVSSIMNRQWGYGQSQNMNMLRPDILDRSVFWENTHSCVVTKPEILEVLHKGEKVTVHRTGIESLSESKATLTDGTEVQVDTVIFATGWNIVVQDPSHSESASRGYLRVTSAAHLGLPYPKAYYPKKLSMKWRGLDQEAEFRVNELFPRLASSPSFYRAPTIPYTPFRLYNCILPTSLYESNDRSFVFVGAIGTGYTAIVSEVHALWAVAWMTGRLELKLSVSDMEKEVALLSVWMRKRYLTAGEKMPYILYDFLPMIDVMLKELGIASNRKKGPMRELFDLYRPIDYQGLVEEWRTVHAV